MEQISTLKKSIEGGKWTFINTVSKNAVSLLSFLILARLLSPEDFGILAVILVIPNFMILISTTGLETALIQKREDPTPYLNPIWTIGIIKSFAIFFIIFFLAPLITAFFQIEQAATAVRLSGIVVLLTGTSNVAQLFFFKNIDFKKIFIRDISGAIAYSATAVTLAIYYRSFWPLFIATLVQYAVGNASTYFLHEFRPRLSLEFKKLFHLIGYSKWIYGQNLVDRLSPTIENSFIAKIMGASDVGLFTKAKSLVSIPTAPFYNIIDRVAFPSYARVQDSCEKIKNGLLKSLDILFFISVPIAFIFVMAGRDIILIFLGEKWIGMDLPLRIVAVAFAVGAFSSSALPIFNAVGKPKVRFGIMLVNLGTLVISLLALTPPYGVAGAAAALLITHTTTSFASIIMLKKIIGVKLSEIIKPSLIPLTASGAILIVERLWLASFGPATGALFIILISFLGIIYLGLIVFAGTMFNLGPYATIRLIVSEVLSPFKNKNLETEKIPE